MKSLSFCIALSKPSVTPFAGVWIEMLEGSGFDLTQMVTPFAGVWIEIFYVTSYSQFISVTPFAGVWIEIPAYRPKN